MAKSEGPSISNFMHQMLRVDHTDFMHQMLRVGHTEHTSFPRLDAPVNEDKYATFNSISSEFYYRLGMAKSEGPSIPNFMHQMLRVGHTEHTSTIIPKIGRTCE